MWRDTPTEFKELSLTLDPDGKFILCGVCQEHDVRRSSQNGIVTCTRGRFYKFDSFKEHAKTSYHEASVGRRDRLMDSKAVMNGAMTEQQYEARHKCRWEAPKKKQKVTSFFKPIAKKTSNAIPANRVIETMSENADINTDSPNSHSNSSVGDDVVGQSGLDAETVSPPAEISPVRRYEAQEYSKFCTQNRLIYGRCHGTVSSSDLTNFEFQKGLEALSVVYKNTNNHAYYIMEMQPAGIYIQYF